MVKGTLETVNLTSLQMIVGLDSIGNLELQTITLTVRMFTRVTLTLLER